VKIGYKFQSLGKISHISAADPPVLLRQFQHCVTLHKEYSDWNKQGSPAVAGKPARRESMPKLLQFEVVTTLLRTIYWPIFIRLAAVASEICEIRRNCLKIQTYIEFKVIQGHRSWCQSKAHMQLLFSHKY